MDSISKKLYEEGYRGLIFDIDNTLVPHGAPADARAIALFDRLKKIGFKCCLISNNQEPRVKMFNEPIQVDYVYGDFQYSCETDSPKRRDSDCAEEIFGEDCVVFLCKKQETGEKIVEKRHNLL